MSTSESVHHVRNIKIVYCGPVNETSKRTIDLTAEYDVTAWKDTPTLTEKQITFFLDDESFEGIELGGEMERPSSSSALPIQWVSFDKEPSSLEDRKAAAQETVAMFEHDHDLIMYIAELYCRLETTDPSFSLEG